MGFEVKEVQSTPNPNALKFVLDRQIANPPISFFNVEAVKNHPLASKLFAIPGITSVLLLGDFVTINKRPDVDWKSITPAVKRLLELAEPAT